MISSVISYFISLSATTCLLFSTSLSYTVPPSVEINLDLAPNQRFVSAVETVLDLHGYENTFFPIFNQSNVRLFSSIPKEDYSLFSSMIKEYYPQNYNELQGISNTFIKYGYYVSVDYLSMWVYFHELGHALFDNNNYYHYNNNQQRECTGILVLDTDNNIWHGRNMDQSYQSAKNITLKLSFTKNNVTLYEGFDWYWFNTGIMTLYKKDTITIQENWRMENISYNDMKIMIKNGTMPQVFVFRNAMNEIIINNTKNDKNDKNNKNNKNTNYYNEIVNYIGNIPLASPMYVIIGGLNGKKEAGIITRECEPHSNILNKYNYMDLTNITYNNNNNNGNNNKWPDWWLVQTNYDHWLQDPSFDDRRTIAQNLMLNWTQSYDAMPYTVGTNIMAVLSSYSVHNEDTLYTAVMSAAKGVFLTYVRDNTALFN